MTVGFPMAEEQILKNLRHNVIFNVADGASWLFAISFVSTTTILPVYVSHLTTSTVLIGAVPALESLGWYLPQLIVAPLVEGIPQVKPLLLKLTLAERFPFLVIALLIATVPFAVGGQSTFLLILFLLILGGRFFASGVAAIPYQEMIARIIPARARGRFFGSQRFFGGITGLISAGLAVEILARAPYPLNFALCFGCAFIGVMVSYFLLAQTREPPLKIGSRPEHMRTYWKEMLIVLRRDKNFAAYMASRSVGYLGTMATAFFAVHAVQAFSLGDSDAGVFNAILVVSGLVAGAVWGWVGDRWGEKRVLTGSMFLYVVALSIAWLNESPQSYYAIFALVGISNSGLIISELALVLEFAPPERRPAYLGLARTLLGPWVGLAPIIGGLLIAQLGFGGMIGLSWMLTLVGFTLVFLKVREPRRLLA